MHLIQILLPAHDRNGQPWSRESYEPIRAELADHFGGVTASLRTPMQGLWESPEGVQQREDMVLVEVMCERLDRMWWHDYRRKLEHLYDQREVLLRAVAVERL